ncbi:MAG: hypothetical protein AAGF95_10155 [Chloroflexota bacterium]
MHRWLRELMTVGNQPTNQIDQKVAWMAMPGMCDLRDVLQLVNNRPLASFVFTEGWDVPSPYLPKE